MSHVLTRSIAETAIDRATNIVEGLLNDSANSTGLHLLVGLRVEHNYALLAERSWGDPAGWRNAWDEVARAKTALSARTGLSTRESQFLTPLTLQTSDVMWWGNAIDGPVIVSCSGLQPWFDEAICSAVIALCRAGVQDTLEANKAAKRGNFYDS